jgi:hypothetical protein
LQQSLQLYVPPRLHPPPPQHTHRSPVPPRTLFANRRRDRHTWLKYQL